MAEASVTNLEAQRLSRLITEEWLASQSDSGAIWESARKALIEESAKHSPEIVVEAQRLARERWDKWIQEINNANS